MSNSIETQIDLAAPQSRVWRALTDYREFGAWFRVRLDGPFVAGQATSGNITYPGYEHLRFEVKVRAIEPEAHFSFHWHPYAVDPAKDYSAEVPTLVEFTLEKSARGTLLRVVESGFDKLPPDRRAEAFRMNEGGWAIQMENIAKYLEA
ncbi:SRPBCC family protein [Methylovirgula sp. 4M-Z18]|uniref:SRPBCC family protein n=1 Tax=Methylovirgula sp. 4M-Z18 TaxID=2293567 RepID=UPI000E2EBC23|nr:SRPBCC family protein [Methylovirgula sp. 4M-Z18]RFB80677.1 vanillate O-demethylase oxidoreductase VanB [Methylovirgula sp. 4M-Z18]